MIRQNHLPFSSASGENLVHEFYVDAAHLIQNWMYSALCRKYWIHAGKMLLKRLTGINNDCDIFQVLSCANLSRHMTINVLVYSQTFQQFSRFWCLRLRNCDCCVVSYLNYCAKLQGKVNRTWLKIMWAIFASFITRLSRMATRNGYKCVVTQNAMAVFPLFNGISNNIATPEDFVMKH